MLEQDPADPLPDPDGPGDPTGDPDEESEQPRTVRRLRRSEDDKVIAGVAGGLGRYIGVDSVVIRVAFVLLTLAGGAGILLYLVLALVIPRERVGEQYGPARDRRARSLTRVIGWMLIVAGAFFLVGRFVPELEQLVWPVALLGLGVAVLVQGSRS